MGTGQIITYNSATGDYQGHCSLALSHSCILQIFIMSSVTVLGSERDARPVLAQLEGKSGWNVKHVESLQGCDSKFVLVNAPSADALEELPFGGELALFVHVTV